MGYFVLRAGLAYASHHRILRSSWASLLLALPVVACVYLALSSRLHSQYVPAPVNGIYFHNKATQWQYLVDLYFLIVGDPSQIHQALLNLCLNSVEAMPEGGTLTLSTHIVAGPAAHVEIYDRARERASGCPWRWA